MKNVNIFIKCFFLSFFFFFGFVSAAYIYSDKGGYDFEEIITINGREFPINLELTVEIVNRLDVVVRQIDVTSDSEGNFTTTYFIPAEDSTKGIIEGTYTVAAGIQGETPTTTFDVTSEEDTTPPTFSNPQTNETEPGKPCEFKLTWDDNRALHPFGQYIFSTNNSGTWRNATRINFTSTPQTVTNVTKLNSTESLVQWKCYASDNNSNWTVSDTYELNVVTTVPCDLHSVNVSPECSGGSSAYCESAERIIVNATYSGDCPDPAYIQVNANGTGCYICDQDRDVCADDICNMTGITVTCDSSPCSVGWTIHNVPSECQGKFINTTYASLNSNYPCRADAVKRDEVTPNGSFTLALTTTVPGTTSPNGNGGNGGSPTTSSTITTTVVTTTYHATTITPTTTSGYGSPTTTLPEDEEGGISTYWIILIIIIVVAVGIFVYFKFFRTGAVTKEESEFDALKRKWSRNF